MIDYGYSAKFIMKYEVLFYSEDIEVDHAGFYLYKGKGLNL